MGDWFGGLSHYLYLFYDDRDQILFWSLCHTTF